MFSTGQCGLPATRLQLRLQTLQFRLHVLWVAWWRVLRLHLRDRLVAAEAARLRDRLVAGDAARLRDRLVAGEAARLRDRLVVGAAAAAYVTAWWWVRLPPSRPSGVWPGWWCDALDWTGWVSSRGR